MHRFLVGTLGTAIVLFYAIGSVSLVASDSEWYDSLQKPFWQPPGFVFGAIWPYNFTVLILATWVVATRLSTVHHWVWLASLTLSVAAALTWAQLFYGPHAFLASGLALLAASLLTVPLLVLSFRASHALGFAVLPYQVWLLLATSLAFGYAAQ